MIESFLNFTVTLLHVYSVWCIFISIFIGAALWLFIEGRTTKIPLSVSVLGVLFILSYLFLNYINPYFTGYGYATDNFEVVAQEDNVIWSMNSWGVSENLAPGGGTEIAYKIQGLTLDSGTKLFRRLIMNKCEVLGNKNHLVWLSINKEIIGMDLMSGKTRITVNEENLMKKFPDLAKGVYQYKFNPKTSLFDVKSKDGLNISIDPVANVKIDHPIERIAENLGYDISKKDKKNGVTFNGAIKQNMIDQTGHVINKDLTFLAPESILFDEPSGKSIIMSYETLDKKAFILRCLSLDGKLLWEAKQHNLKIGNFLNPEPKFAKAFFYKDKAILAFYGFILSMDVSNGHVNWLMKM